jgi:hypothetical protein
MLIRMGRTKTVTLDELSLIETPQGSETHQPIPHWDLASGMKNAVEGIGLSIVSYDLGLSADNQTLFGNIDIQTPSERGYNFSIGFRHSNDKKVAFGVVTGFKVTVCSNMAFAGEFKPVLVKHTPGAVANLNQLMVHAVKSAAARFSSTQEMVDLWKTTNVSDEQARNILQELMFQPGIAINSTLIQNVWDEYLSPRFNEFKENTLWSLHNAFTTVLNHEPTQLHDSYRLLESFGDFFKMQPFLLKGN